MAALSANVMGCCPLAPPQLRVWRSNCGSRESVRLTAFPVRALGLQKPAGTDAQSTVDESNNRTSCNQPLEFQAAGLLQVFQDEEHGIRCYQTPSGEITCEGFDEGPHFHPIARVQQRSVMKNANCVSILTRGTSLAASPAPEVSVYKQVQGGRGEVYCEGKDES